jgi:hypothetical protein
LFVRDGSITAKTIAEERRLMLVRAAASSRDLQRLINEEIQESLTLEYKASPSEYKASPSLAKDSLSGDKLCKDVSAFAMPDKLSKAPQKRFAY